MRAAHLGTRLAGTDGVSLEATKVANVLERMGFERIDVAGEVETPGAVLIPEMHFRDPTAVGLQARAFGSEEPNPDLEQDLADTADALADRLRPVIRDLAPDLLVIQNAWAIPMQLPLAGALAQIVEETQLPTLSHEHDYAWERERFSRNCVADWLDSYFPWEGPTVRHLAINTPAAESLHARRGLHATVVPNVMDFSRPMPSAEEAQRVRGEVRAALDLSPEQRIILQPTRVIPRKGIHLAIDLLAQLEDPRNVLVISHESGDEGETTLQDLVQQASQLGVDLRYVPHLFTPVRTATTFALEDAYVAAGFVTYPSLYEGFGNALLETLAFRRAALVNRYAVYQRDIAPTGLEFVEIDDEVTPEAVEQVRQLLDHPERCEQIAERNRSLAAEHFGMQALETALRSPLASLGITP